MRTRHLPLALAATAALLLSGCSSTPASSDSGSSAGSGIALPASIEEKGAIDVGVYFNYPPYTFEEDGELQGIEADLMRAVADELGIEVEFHDLAFEAMIPSVINGRMDALIGPMGDSAERQKEVTFIDTLNSRMQAVVKKGNPTDFDIAEPCGAKGGEVAASNNLTTVTELSEKCEADGEKAIDILSLPDAGNVFQAVISDRTQFTVQDPALAQYMTETNPDLELQGDSIPAAGGDLQGWIVGKDNTELTSAIVAAIDALIADGTWGEIMEAGGLTDAALDAPLVNGKEPVN